MPRRSGVARAVARSPTTPGSRRGVYLPSINRSANGALNVPAAGPPWQSAMGEEAPSELPGSLIHSASRLGVTARGSMPSLRAGGLHQSPGTAPLQLGLVSTTTAFV